MLSSMILFTPFELEFVEIPGITVMRLIHHLSTTRYKNTAGEFAYFLKVFALSFISVES